MSIEHKKNRNDIFVQGLRTAVEVTVAQWSSNVLATTLNSIIGLKQQRMTARTGTSFFK
jgi:hypothetical protein